MFNYLSPDEITFKYTKNIHDKTTAVIAKNVNKN